MLQSKEVLSWGYKKVQAYDAALESEDFQEAARLRDEGAVGMRGWWYMQSSSVDNPPHLLRIRQAIDRYVLLAYSPQDIATIHVSLPCILSSAIQSSVLSYTPLQIPLSVSICHWERFSTLLEVYTLQLLFITSRSSFKLFVE